jgi:hypothetical protein
VTSTNASFDVTHCQTDQAWLALFVEVVRTSNLTAVRDIHLSAHHSSLTLSLGRSATAEVDHKLQDALRNVTKKDKKKLLQELKARDKLEGVNEMEGLEVEVQRIDEREEEEVDTPMSDPEDAMWVSRATEG